MKLLALIGAVIVPLVLPAAGEAQAPARTARIGLLDYGAPSASGEARWSTLRERLRELGYAEGRNVSFEARWANGHGDRLSDLATEMVEHKVDVIVTVTTRPSWNLNGKRLELLKQMLPHATRVAMVRDPDNRSSTATLKAAESLGRPLGLTIQAFELRPDRFDSAFPSMKRAHVEAIVMADNTPFLGVRQRLSDLAISHRLPVIASAREYAEAGTLMSYGTDYPDLFRRAAGYVDRILRGAKPAELPIEQPTKFELVLNLKTSRALGLTVPPQILGRADEVIE